MATAALSPPALRPSPGGAAPRTDVRQGLRALLSSQQGFAQLNDDTRRDLAGSLARIGSVALDNQEVSEGREPPRPAMARAMNAGSEFSGVATDRLARTTRDVLDAVSFPRFVTELITGVFKAMNDSNQQQLTAFVELIRNVAQTTEGFADSNVGISRCTSVARRAFPDFVRRPGRRRGRVRGGPVRPRARGAPPAPGRDPGRARRRYPTGAPPRRQLRRPRRRCAPRSAFRTACRSRHPIPRLWSRSPARSLPATASNCCRR